MASQYSLKLGVKVQETRESSFSKLSDSRLGTLARPEFYNLSSRLWKFGREVDVEFTSEAHQPFLIKANFIVFSRPSRPREDGFVWFNCTAWFRDSVTSGRTGNPTRDRICIKLNVMFVVPPLGGIVSSRLKPVLQTVCIV